MSWLSKDELLLEQYLCSDCAWYGEGEGGQAVDSLQEEGRGVEAKGDWDKREVVTALQHMISEEDAMALKWVPPNAQPRW